ncbi:glycosyltransferase family 4 protein [Mesorhizobium sp. A556]
MKENNASGTIFREIKASSLLARDEVDPLRHFLQHSRKHRLSPSRSFDTGRYLDQHVDARNSKLNPLVHYLKHGRARGLEIHAAPPSEADRILASSLFDAEWYLDHRPDVAAANHPALLHYLVHGALEGRSPGPNFNAEWYLMRYPDVVGLNPLIHFIDHGLEEGRIAKQPARALEIARQTLAGVEDLDPELYGADYFADAGRLDVVDARRNSRVSRCFEHVVETLASPPRHVVFLPWLLHGGADLVACHAIRALAETYGAASVLVVLTDHDREEAPHLLPEGVSLISLSRIEPALSQAERVELVDLLIRSLQPDTVLNVNSQACWEAVRRGGRKLQHFTRLYAMLFCPDFSPADRRRSGYADTYLRHCLPFLAGIYFDNASYIEEVTQQFGIPAELQSRLVVLRQPAPAPAKIARRARKKGQLLRVLWASRIAPQKNIDLLMRIAEAAPEIKFHIWGRGSHALEGLLDELAARHEHVHFHGPFERFDRLPLGEYDAFVYTSLWDGIPNILLESAAAGLPIVAPDVGGIGELVDKQTGWLIADTNDPAPYVKALGEIRDRPRQAVTRVEAMRGRLRENHDWKRYREILASQPHTTGGLLNGAGIDNGGTDRASRGDAGKAVAGKPETRSGAGRKSRVRG